MNLSFIVTTYNLESYIERCLDSVLEVARPGDEIIVVDDGSKDQTTGVVNSILFSEKRHAAVEVKPIFLGSNTMGGVGIAGNIGMDIATRDGVFFVDGDDWLDVAGFNLARDMFERMDCDILLANYQEFDEQADAFKAPADEWRWLQLSGSSELRDQQLDAVEMIAVPWRKFYRRDFLNHNRLRFPEGNFFFEDNPFHWEVCLKAQSIKFLDVTLCYHRVNRPGQTMASTGLELIAFLDHFETITSNLPVGIPEIFRERALSWLLGNMSWHLERLQPKAAPYYFRRAAEVLARMGTGGVTDNLPAPFLGTEVARYIMVLEHGGWMAAQNCFLSDFSLREMHRIGHQLQGAITQARSETLECMTPIRNAVATLHDIAEYEMYYDEAHAKTP